MENQEQIRVAVMDKLRLILKLSLPHCDDDNPNEKDFVDINRLAHEALIKLERLRI